MKSEQRELSAQNQAERGQGKARVGRTRQGEAGQGRARPGQGRARPGQGRARQGGAGWSQGELRPALASPDMSLKTLDFIMFRPVPTLSLIL